MLTYFIANGPPESGTQVKIGRTDNLAARLAQLQTASPHQLRVLAQVHGDKEQLFHRRFKEDREVGEWFAWSLDMQQFIDCGCHDDMETDLLKLLHSSDFSASYTIACPVCKDIYHHFDTPPEVNDGNYDCRTTKQIRIQMDGECGHTWWLVLSCYKGHAKLSVST